MCLKPIESAAGVHQRECHLDSLSNGHPFSFSSVLEGCNLLELSGKLRIPVPSSWRFYFVVVVVCFVFVCFFCKVSATVVLLPPSHVSQNWAFQKHFMKGAYASFTIKSIRAVRACVCVGVRVCIHAYRPHPLRVRLETLGCHLIPLVLLLTPIALSVLVFFFCLPTGPFSWLLSRKFFSISPERISILVGLLFSNQEMIICAMWSMLPYLPLCVYIIFFTFFVFPSIPLCYT